MEKECQPFLGKSRLTLERRDPQPGGGRSRPHAADAEAGWGDLTLLCAPRLTSKSTMECRNNNGRRHFPFTGICRQRRRSQRMPEGPAGRRRWKVNDMMSPDPYSPGGSPWQSPAPERLPARQVAGGPAAFPAPPGTDRPAEATGNRPPRRAPQGGIMHRQLMRLMGEILGDEGLNSEIRLALLRHISEHPGHPEQAMLAHLREIQDGG